MSFKIMSFKNLYKHSSPSLVSRVLEDFLLNSELSGAPIENDNELDSDNLSIPIKKWRGCLSELGFTCVNHNHDIYSFWYTSFFNYPVSLVRHATINIVFDNDFRNDTISHILTCIYQGDSERKVLIGNVEELYEKVSERLSILVEMISVLKDEDTCFKVLVDSKYDKNICAEHLISLAKNGKLTWESIYVFLPEELQNEHRTKINSEKFNL